MCKAALAVALAAIAASAQNNGPSSAQGQQNASISGGVQDEGTGAPIASVLVSVYINTRFSNGTIYMSPEAKEIKATTDDRGHYRLSDLPPGPYRVSARGKDILGPRGEKMVNLRSGQDLSGIDFSFPAYGVISGNVMDQNKEPVPGATVYLMSKEYATGGGVRYFYKRVATTDDRGEYTLSGVEPGFPNLLMAAKPMRFPAAVSDAPANQKLRKPAFVPTFYPNVEQPEGAAPIVLRGGERREGVDIRLLRAPSFCIEGSVGAGGGSITGRFMVAGAEYNSGIASGGGLALPPPSGSLASDGKLRICGLRRGDYRLMAYFSQPDSREGPSQYGTAAVTIRDEDVKDVRVMPVPGLQVPGTVAWEGSPADPPLTSKVAVLLQPLNRPNLGERGGFVRADVPGEFLIPNVFMDDYRVSASVNAPGVYVKDILYGASSVLDVPVRVGSATDLRVVLAHDGGSIAVRVADKDGNPVPDIHVVILPVELQSEASLPGRLVRGEPDQDGTYSHGVLAPGKYLVLATAMKIDPTFDKVQRLWRARGRAKIVELGPNGNAQVTIEPVRIE
jgi:protocatechuate 3,4-dioxygenase beta subunit